MHYLYEVSMLCVHERLNIAQGILCSCVAFGIFGRGGCGVKREQCAFASFYS